MVEKKVLVHIKQGKFWRSNKYAKKEIWEKKKSTSCNRKTGHTPWLISDNIPNIEISSLIIGK